MRPAIGRSRNLVRIPGNQKGTFSGQFIYISVRNLSFARRNRRSRAPRPNDRPGHAPFAVREAFTEASRRHTDGSPPAEAESYRLLFEKNPLPMWVFDLETRRLLDVNDTAVQTYGFTRAEFLEMKMEDILTPQEVPRFHSALRDLRPTDRLVALERHRKKDGTTFEVEVLSTEVSVLSRRARLVLVNDVTDRLRAERHQATEIAVTRVLIDSKSFSDAAPRVLAAISEAEEWALGELWLYDGVASVLRLDGTWQAPGLQDMQGMELVRSGLAVRPGAGLVGRVWQRGAPIWIRDVREESDAEWAASAERLGLHSALGFPIRTRFGVEAVMVLFSPTTREPDEALLDLMADIGSRIGQVLERDQAEAAWRASVEAFQKAFHASPVPMGISGLRDGRFIEVNVQFLRMFGYDRTDVVGHTAVELEMWVDPEQRRILADRLRENGSIRDADVEIRTKSGNPRRALLSVEYLDLKGQPTIITTLVDITDLAAAREAQARLAAIVEGSEDAIVGKALDGTITNWNAGAERIYGYAPKEAIGQPVSMLVPDDRREELDRIMERLRRGEKVAPFETVRLRKDGRKIVVAVTVSPIHDAQGRIIGMSAIARDITDRKRGDQLVRRSEARFRQLFDVAADATFLIDHRGTILDANPAGAALLGGRDPGALRGINLGEVLPTRELEKARGYLRDLLHDRAVVEPFETYVEPKDGTRRFVQVRSRVIREEGTEPYVQVVARDVTPEKESQRRLLESERRASMGQVAAFVAHEINTPLTNISLLSANLARGITDPRILGKLSKIDSQRRLAANIVSEVLALTRSQDLRRIPVDARGIVQAAIEQTSSFRTDDVKLIKDLPPDPLIASLDPLRIQRALGNLLKNAYQATATGSVTVRLKAEDGQLTIAVVDTGTGMDEEVRSRLFQPFYTTKPRTEGIGLGLLLAKQVVQAHDGTILVVSEAGRGSTFTITLPYGADEAALAKAASFVPGISPKAP